MGVKEINVENIYTIPINEVLEEVAENPSLGCPVCRIMARLEENELDLILGASMMEPDIRIRTNREGFCRDHYDKMLTMGNRLSFSLMMESHLDEVKKGLEGSLLTAILGKKHEAAGKYMDKMRASCYICGKVETHLSRMLSNLAALYHADETFRKKYAAQPYFCIPHARALLECAKKEMAGKELAAFSDVTMQIEHRYLDSLREDVSWFCKKNDYRYQDEPWGNAKDAPIRAAAFLTGKAED